MKIPLHLLSLENNQLDKLQTIVKTDFVRAFPVEGVEVGEYS